MTGHTKKSGTDSPSTSVIIPVHNGGTAFVQCLRAHLASRKLPNEIIVAANGCQDRSIEVARLAGATVIENPRAVGPAAARNAAARKARGDLLFFVDADVAVHPDALDRVLTCFRHHPDIAACFGSYDHTPPETNFFSQYKNLFHHFIHQQADPQATTFWTGCGAVRRVVFEEMGGFDETYLKPAIEDIELGYRMIARGHQIRLDKHLLATHLKHWNLISLLKSDIFDRAFPWAQLILRSGSWYNSLNTKLRYRLSVLLVALMAGLMPAGLFTGITLWPTLFTAVLLIAINGDWYRFTLQRKGWFWTIRAVGWHWIYYFYCGLIFAYAAVKHWISFQAHPGHNR